MQVRDAVAADVDGLVQLLNETDSAAGQLSHQQVAEMLKTWQLRVAVADAGRIDGCGGILAPARDETHVMAGIVQRSDVDMSGQLLDWILRRSVELPRAGRGPVDVEMVVRADDRRQCELLPRVGFRLNTRLWLMERAIAVEALPAALPGVRVDSYDQRYFDSFAACYAAVYVDQRVVDPPLDRSALQALVKSDGFRPELSALAIAGDEVVGFMLVSDDRTPGRIEISPVGTLRSWRGRGIASGLLLYVLDRCARAGVNVATLLVDADSPTGAMRLYQRHGFRTTSTLHVYRRPIK
jgi:ribosomal protein S18 acetylase RimI-like enzyme